MRNYTDQRRLSILFSLFSVFFMATGCSSASHRQNSEVSQVSSEKSSEDVESQQAAQVPDTAPPVIVNPRAEPKIVTLSRDFSVDHPIHIYAEVKNLGSKLDSVKLALTFSPDVEESLRFFNRPVEVDMKHMNGTTWKAVLSDDEIRKLAISGKTLKYEAHVVAKNDKGQETVSGDPIQITVQAPVSVG